MGVVHFTPHQQLTYIGMGLGLGKGLQIELGLWLGVRILQAIYWYGVNYTTPEKKQAGILPEVVKDTATLGLWQDQARMSFCSDLFLLYPAGLCHVNNIADTF